MTPASGERPDDEVLVEYLLGTLSAEEAERVDELSIADDEVASRLQAVENDLVDAYVAGRLSGRRLEQFKSFYLMSPVRQRRVDFARTLTALGHAAVPAIQPHVPRRILPQWALAAAALVAAVAVGYFALENRRLREQVSRSAAARAAGEQTAQSLRTELEQERSASAAARSEHERLRGSVPSARSSIQALVLLPLRRGAGEVPTVLVQRGTGQLPLRLRLEGDAFPRYEAALRDPAGRSVWRSGPIEARPQGTDQTLAVDVPAALLRSANYTVELAGMRRTAAAEFVTSYAFRVVVE
ncbi:MAG TPA: hypothetical protein VJ813_16500 [Vicinamibacterales bacterium]|nr:hypothetical protein [Vicinamibacterales bacterium]